MNIRDLGHPLTRGDKTQGATERKALRFTFELLGAGLLAWGILFLAAVL